MRRGIELPLATAALEPTHAEPARALTLFHLTEHWLDARPALAIEAAAPLGPQLALHPLARRHPLRHAPARRWRLAPRGALLAILLGRDEQLASRGLAGGAGLRPVARVRHRRAKHGILAQHRL